MTVGNVSSQEIADREIDQNQADKTGPDEKRGAKKGPQQPGSAHLKREAGHPTDEDQYDKGIFHRASRLGCWGSRLELESVQHRHKVLRIDGIVQVLRRLQFNDICLALV